MPPTLYLQGFVQTLKNKYSLISCFLICVSIMVIRFAYTDRQAQLPVKVTTWDALGYYMYLPAQFIYHDEKNLNWFPKIDSLYALTGGNLYQANKQENGNYVFKYLEGVSILQLPFFLIAYSITGFTSYPQDGFSYPYQLAVAWGCIIWCMIAIFLLRNILLRYYNDCTVAVTLVLLLIASNFLQYVSVEGGQSHGYIFPMYVFLLYFTIRWHEKRSWLSAFFIGGIIGLATISRPTELVMIFIPILWNVRNGKDFNEKVMSLFEYPSQMISVAVGFWIGILPQLLYWKRVTGSFVYDVGSKWDFLNPHFRVLFGWEKGWFIYTPVTLLFVAGLFMLRGKEFSRAVMTFCVLNIYIIIAWHIWRYGGSYSCRALVQSYPVFAFPLAACVSYLLEKKWRLISISIFSFLVIVNLFQIYQYNRTIIHYDDMNFEYYRAIYLDPDPDALDMSLLDTKDIIKNEKDFQMTTLFSGKKDENIEDGAVLFDEMISVQGNSEKGIWYKIITTIFVEQGLWGSSLQATLSGNGNTQEIHFRMANALTSEQHLNTYSFYIKPEDKMRNGPYHFQIIVSGNSSFKGKLNTFEVLSFKKN